jgi:hypothetical protein
LKRRDQGERDQTADEIERLTAENEVMAKHIEAVQIIWDGCDSERMELRARVEELEKEKHPEISVTAEGDKITLYVNGEPRPVVPHAVNFGEIHLFTNEQIDAAVEYANEQGRYNRPGARRVLNKLNIFLCGQCGGSGFHTVRWLGAVNPEEWCCNCNGHGWTKEQK